MLKRFNQSTLYISNYNMPNKITRWFWKGVLRILIKMFPYDRDRLEGYMQVIEDYEKKWI